jgi:undecaprenyl-diphosphatase
MAFKELMELDEKVTWAIRLKEQDNRIKPMAAFFAHSGDSWFIEVALLLIWLFTLDHYHQLSALIAGTVAILAVLVLAVKFKIRRPRPEGEWGAIYRNTDPHSFPSGHAARVAMLATMALTSSYLLLGVILIIWGLLVCLARIWMGVHYLSDILAGIVLGILFGFLMTALSSWFIQTIPWVFTNQSSLLPLFGT